MYVSSLYNYLRQNYCDILEASNNEILHFSLYQALNPCILVNVNRNVNRRIWVTTWNLYNFAVKK
jgi:hypothetical protein